MQKSLVGLIGRQHRESMHDSINVTVANVLEKANKITPKPNYKQARNIFNNLKFTNGKATMDAPIKRAESLQSLVSNNSLPRKASKISLKPI